MFDLTDVGYVKRIVVGRSDLHASTPEAEIQAATEFLNRCLTEFPRGKIISIEKDFKVLDVDGNQAILQWVTYHVGFSRKPHWFE